MESLARVWSVLPAWTWQNWSSLAHSNCSNTSTSKPYYDYAVLVQVCHRLTTRTLAVLNQPTECDDGRDRTASIDHVSSHASSEPFLSQGRLGESGRLRSWCVIAGSDRVCLVACRSACLVKTPLLSVSLIFKSSRLLVLLGMVSRSSSHSSSRMDPAGAGRTSRSGSVIVMMSCSAFCTPTARPTELFSNGRIV